MAREASCGEGMTWVIIDAIGVGPCRCDEVFRADKGYGEEPRRAAQGFGAGDGFGQLLVSADEDDGLGLRGQQCRDRGFDIQRIALNTRLRVDLHAALV